MRDISEFITKLYNRGIVLSVKGDSIKIQSPESEMSSEIMLQIKENKSEIISFLEQQIQSKNTLLSVNSIERFDFNNGHPPASYAQQRLWFLQQMQKDSTQYNLRFALNVEGDLDLTFVESAFSRIIKRHHPLRTVFINQDDVLCQKILEKYDLPLICHDFTDLADENRQQKIAKVVKTFYEQPFDLDCEIMLRISHLKLSTDAKENSGILLFCTHHIASDGISMKILIREFVREYLAIKQGEGSPFSPLEIQYADYAYWQRKSLEGEILENQLKYWEQQLNGIPEVHSLPLDYSRPKIKTYEGKVFSTNLDSTLSDRLEKIALDNNVTLFMLLHGALSLVISRHSNTQDIVIATPVANRVQAELEPLIGFFVNTLILRVNTQYDNFVDYLEHVKKVNLDAQSNQDIPFEQLVEQCKLTRTAQYTPLFQIMFSMISHQESELKLPGVKFTPYDGGECIAKFDLDISAKVTTNGIKVFWNYDSSIFNKESIKRLSKHFERLLFSIAEAPKSKIKDLVMLSDEELDYLVNEKNSTNVAYPQEKLLHELFESQAEKTPDNVAIVIGGEQLTYSEVNKKSNQLASYLVEQGVSPESLVGVCISRSFDMVLALLATLKTGAAYVPLDPNYPDARLQFMLEDSNASHLITNKELAFAKKLTKNIELIQLNLQNDIQEIEKFPVDNLRRLTGGTQASLAYVIYTSGSTGKPKGVMVQHQGLTNYLHHANKHYLSTSVLGSVVSSSLCFDATVTSLWTPICFGKKIELLPEKDDTLNLLHQRLFESNEPLLFKITPAHLEALKHLKGIGCSSKIEHKIVVGGEEFPKFQLAHWKIKRLPAATFVNEYGPTETVVGCSTFTISENSEILNLPKQTVPIGKAIQNTNLFIVGKDGSLQPQYCIGELYIGGDGVSQGYLNHKELTKQNFCFNSFTDDPTARLYRTGDRVRYLSNGELDFIGRIDEQIKIRGFRIEPKEIELLLSSCDELDSNIVLAKKDESGQQYLVAYIIAKDTLLEDIQVQANLEKASLVKDNLVKSELVKSELVKSQLVKSELIKNEPVKNNPSQNSKALAQQSLINKLKKVLAANLPSYMVPSVFVLVEEFPLTTNGKIDKKALLTTEENLLLDKYIAPRNETETSLVRIWSKLLEKKKGSISTGANFFELGGHSLLVIRLITEIRNQLKQELTISVVFDNPTISALAKRITLGLDVPMRASITTVRRNESNALLLSFAQQRLWFIDQLQGESTQYNIPMVFTVKGEFNTAAAEDAISKIIQRHEPLRTTFHQEQGEAVQIVNQEFTFKLKQIDLSHYSRKAQDLQVEKIVKNDRCRPFNLKADLMVRSSFIYLSKTINLQKGILLLNMHHIASDGWSMNLLIKEFEINYKALTGLLTVKDNQPEFSPLKISYIDYSLWQRQWLQGEVLESQLDYWRKQLEQVPIVHSLPLDFARPKTKEYDGGIVTQSISLELSEKLELVANNNNVTLFMLLHAALALVLSRHSNSHDIVIATPVANRMQSELEPLIGFFVNTLALRLNTEFECFTDYLRQVKQVNLDAQANQDIPFELLLESCQIPRNPKHTPLFQIAFSINNNQRYQLDLPGVEFTPLQQEQFTAKFDLDISAQPTIKGTVFSWIYDKAIYSSQTVETLSGHLTRILMNIADSPNANTVDLAMLSESEKCHLVNGLNPEYQNQSVDFPQDKLIHKLFEKKAIELPEKIALVFNDCQLTYQEVNEASNQLAHCLRLQGIEVGSFVGIYIERSIDMVIAILAILKAGGAYVPLDTNYPKSRLQYMLDDTGLRYLLSQKNLVDKLDITSNIDVISLDSENHLSQLRNLPRTNLELSPCQEKDSMAYVIYTSGSTGNPKGVMVEHQSVVGLCFQNKFIDVAKVEGLLSLSNISFDGSIFDLFFPLINGKTLVVIPQDHVTDIERWEKYCIDYNVNTVFMTTALFNQVTASRHPVLSHFSQLLFGGEKATPEIIGKFLKHHPENKLIHVYGPTETTVYATFAELTIDNYERAPIGKPLADKSILLLDSQKQLVPFGAVGEIYVGGSGVATGYLNKNKLTEASFHSNISANPGERYYRTGDLARYLPEGDLEFIARVDAQVKIRGFRVEIGEIECALLTCDEVEDALVTINESINGQKHLLAYIILTEKADTNDIDWKVSIKSALIEKLPDYMLPQVYIPLERYPLTTNGKVDRKSLPKPEINIHEGQYAAPSNTTESALVKIWSGLLNLKQENLSVSDNFFELGGDSILSIQVVSRAASVGLHFSVKDLFDAQTISRLCPLVKLRKKNYVSQDSMAGEMSLLPIQHEFFADERGINHFNQAMMLVTPVDFNHEILHDIVSKLYQRHDALRLKFLKKNNTWFAEHKPFSKAMVENTLNIENHKQCSFEHDGVYANKIQTSLNPAEGFLFKAIYSQAKDAQSTSSVKSTGRLLLVIHHLVVDGVSWRILLEDIETLYKQWKSNIPLNLPLKTTSYQQWGNYLLDYSRGSNLLSQKKFWLSLNKREVTKLSDFPIAQAISRSSKTASNKASFKLNKSLTSLLLSKTNQSYRTKINEVLLSAVLLGIHRWAGEKSIQIDLETHGRESITDLVDLTRTVGWFTSIYPIQLQLNDEDSLTDIICGVKERCRAIPDNGIGFGALKHLVKDEQVSAISPSEMAFNYLGQFDQVVNDTSHFSLASETVGETMCSDRKAFHPLSLNGMVSGGSLKFILTFDNQVYAETAMNKLMNSIAQALEEIIAHCSTRDKGIYTPSDFPLAKVTKDELKLWSAENEIEDLYPATGMQQGLLFHSTLESGSYVTQTLFRFENLNVEFIKQSWKQVIQRHSIFRTAFVGIDTGNAHQLVKSETDLPWLFDDLSQLNEIEQNEKIESIRVKDKLAGFDASQAPLMRMTILKLTQNTDLLIWSHHHALLDGWCLPLVFSEISKFYKALQLAVKPQLDIVTPYRDYAAWLAKQNHEQSRLFWKEQLKDVKHCTPVPLVTREQNIHETASNTDSIMIAFSEEETIILKEFAQSSRTTVNTLTQAAWALLLSRYSNEETVIFGSVTSGRPADLEGVETILGLFINSLPVVTNVDQELKVEDWLQQLHKQFVLREEHSYLSLSEIKSHAPEIHELFNTSLVFENYPEDRTLTKLLSQSGLKVKSLETFDGTDYAIGIIAHLGKTFSIKMEYQLALLSEPEIYQIAQHFKQLLMSLSTASDMLVGNIEMLSTEEVDYQTRSLNNTHANYPKDTLIHELFERQARLVPNNIALEFNNSKLTYHELNARSNQLASYLRKQGVVCGSLVGLCIQRSHDMVVALLAIVKSGGAYIPLDPDYPSGRLQYMIDDSKLQYLLTQVGLTKSLNFSSSVNILELENGVTNSNILNQPAINLQRFHNQTSADLAYVIYTSGSTGQPKGVMVEHRNLVNHNTGEIIDFDLKSGDKVLHIISISFDPATGHLFSALNSGATVYIEEPLNSLAELMLRKGITHASFTASHLNVLEKIDLPELRLLTIGAERAAPNTISFWSQGRKLLNLYGPTETTISSTKFDYNICKNNRLIGSPLINQKCFILDKQLNIVPLGAAGELYIGGAGVSRGYLNRPELTIEKFINDPFNVNANERLYKTGDIVRYTRDTNLEFIGRQDEQVKIRGYRIELGEIEYFLSLCNEVKSCTVLVKKDKSSKVYLVAYVVPIALELLSSSEDSLDVFNVDNVRKKLLIDLPNHMVPSVFMCIDKMPLTSNGKVDKSSLLQLSIKPLAELIKPRNDVEKELCKIWSEVLGVDEICVRDNYFSIGGDSILSLKIVAEANKNGIRISPRQLFENPTVTDLALVVSSTKEIISEQGQVTGSYPMLPIQDWFFEQEFYDQHHWNLSGLLEIDSDIGELSIRKSLAKLWQHHDALRQTFKNVDSIWQQETLSADFSLDWSSFDLAGEVPEKQLSKLYSISGGYQASFELTGKPLFKVVYFNFGEQKSSRLLLVCHHLIIDAVSWRIILEDLNLLLSQLKDACPIELPPKTSSYKSWTEKLTSYANENTIQAEIKHWLIQQDSQSIPIPRDLESEKLCETKGTVSFSLDENETSALLHQVPKSYDTRIDEVLLTALWKTITDWNGSINLLVNMESHGRDDIWEDFDLSRTVGWFTSSYPLMISIDEKHLALPDLLVLVKEQMRKTPHHGLGYGLLRYSTNRNGAYKINHSELENLDMIKPEVGFNYLGQFGQEKNKSDHGGLVKFSSDAIGESHSDKQHSPYLLNINALVSKNKFKISWTYNTNVHHKNTIKNLANAYLDCLREVINCSQMPEFSLSDYDDAGEVSLVKIKPKGNRIPIFCVHPAGGNTMCYSELSQQFDNNQPIYGLQSRGLESSHQPFTCLRKMAAYYIRAIRSVQSHGPYQILGWSMGGLIAFEISQQLTRAGHEVSFLGLVDSGLEARKASAIKTEEIGTQYLQHVNQMWIKNFVSDESEIAHVYSLSNSQQLTYLADLAKSNGTISSRISLQEAERLLKLNKHNYIAVELYQAEEYAKPLYLFRAKQNELLKHLGSYLGWEKVTKDNLICVDVPGDHSNMVYSPHVNQLASQIKLCLKAISQNKLKKSECVSEC